MTFARPHSFRQMQTGITSFFAASKPALSSAAPSAAAKMTTSDNTSLAEVKEKFCNSIFKFLEEDGWLEILHKEFSKKYMQEVAEFLNAEKVYFPPSPLIFNAFNKCPWDRARVVILGQDPYIRPGQAMGMAFSVPKGTALPPSLKNMYKEMQEDLGLKPVSHGDLTAWAAEGVLLLNTVLTVKPGESNSHKGKGWEKFTDFVIREISLKKTGVVFMLWGGPAQKKIALITKGRGHHILKCPHPSPLSAFRGFFGSKHFSKANELLKADGNAEINWNLDKK